MTWARVTYIPEELSNKLVDLVVASPDYVAATRAWSDCMAGRGHPYAQRNGPEDDITARYRAEGASERLRQQEIEIAVADAECTRETGLIRLVTSLKQRHVPALSAQEQQSLIEVTTAWSRAVAVAESIAK